MRIRGKQKGRERVLWNRKKNNISNSSMIMWEFNDDTKIEDMRDLELPKSESNFVS